MKLSQKISILSVFAIIFAAIPRVWSISPLLCQPRIGDVVKVDILNNTPAITTSAKIVNLTDIPVFRTSEMKIWEPAPDDTTASFYRTIDSEFESIANINGNYRCLYRRTPGYMRRFPQGLPWGMPVNKSVALPVNSIGHADDVTDYHSNGIIKTTITDGITFVSPDGDTIANSVCVEYNIIDTIYYSNTNASLHHGSEQQFYGPGYRYPLLVCHNDTIFDSEGLIVDILEKAYSINPQVQKEDIEDDIVNEEIRRIVAEESLHPKGQNQESHSYYDNQLPPFLKWNSEHNKIVVTNILGMNQMNEILLCDILGHVYYSTIASGTTDSYELDLSICPPGYYVLYIDSAESPYLYRFRL